MNKFHNFPIKIMGGGKVEVSLIHPGKYTVHVNIQMEKSVADDTDELKKSMKYHGHYAMKYLIAEGFIKNTATHMWTCSIKVFQKN